MDNILIEVLSRVWCNVVCRSPITSLHKESFVWMQLALPPSLTASCTKWLTTDLEKCRYFATAVLDDIDNLLVMKTKIFSPPFYL